MTASAQPSKASKFADATEALGFTVTRQKLEGGGRRVKAQRGLELWTFDWVPNDSGKLVLAEGCYTVTGEEPEPWWNVPAALRLMSEGEVSRSPSGQLRRLPFNPDTASDVEVTKAIKNKNVTWRNSISKNEETYHVLSILHIIDSSRSPGRRVLTISSSEGFRSVFLDSILKVK